MKMMRWAELVVLFVAVPFVLGVFLPPSALYPVLGAGAVVGIILLHITPSFQWRSLLGPVRWGEIGALGLVTFIAACALCYVLLPERFLFIVREAPLLLLMLAVFYPLVQVIPQELVYRALFFERYGHLFSSERQAIFVNAVLFAFGHLMYWHPVVWISTFIGSFLFSIAYLRPRGFVQAVALHSIAGLAIFASGLGWLFFSGGNVAQ